MATFFIGYGFQSLWCRSADFTYTHSVFIRSAYKERFQGLVKIFEKITNRLVIFLKIKEQKPKDITEKTCFSLKTCSF